MRWMRPDQYLRLRQYPGRGILLGILPDGCAVIAYFIMGRSASSRSRAFYPAAEGELVIRSTDVEKTARQTQTDLIIYAPVRRWNHYTIVTNGDQTDTIYQSLAAGSTFEQALHRRTFEPDPPLYTPRISGLLEQNADSFSYRMNILKSAEGNPDSVQRFFFEYTQPLPGQGHIMHTYEEGDELLPSFAGEPAPMALPYNDIDSFGAAVWENLNIDNKVALFVRVINTAGVWEDRIYNQNAERNRQ